MSFSSNNLLQYLIKNAPILSLTPPFQMLAEYVTLDSFEDIYRQANDSVKSPCGKITMHIYDEINNDFLPNFCYNASTNRYKPTTYYLHGHYVVYQQVR